MRRTSFDRRDFRVTVYSRLLIKLSYFYTALVSGTFKNTVKLNIKDLQDKMMLKDVQHVKENTAKCIFIGLLSNIA